MLNKDGNGDWPDFRSLISYWKQRMHVTVVYLLLSAKASLESSLCNELRESCLLKQANRNRRGNCYWDYLNVLLKVTSYLT